MTEFAVEDITALRKLLSVDEPERITISKTIAIQALDEIERLQLENAELKIALTQIYVIPNTNNKDIAVECVLQMQDIAQQALNEVTE